MKSSPAAFAVYPPINSEHKKQLRKQTIGQELLNIIIQSKKKLIPLFQPIVNLRSHTVFGHESLIRATPGSTLEFPDQLFSAAANFDLIDQLDLLAREAALSQYDKQSASKHLFLNTSAAIVSEKEFFKHFMSRLELHNVSPDRIVVEITEQSPVKNTKAFLKGTDRYREQGCQIALDDLGSGYNGLKTWSELKPEFVKIDKHFILDISKDAEKHRFIETIYALANSMNSQIIAEGLENEDDLKVLERFGIPFVQGYLFARPHELITDEILYRWPEQAPSLINEEGKVSFLSKPTLSITPSIRISNVVKLFQTHEDIDFFPVTDQGTVFGMVWRKELMNKLASPFGRELFLKKNIESLMDKNPIVVDASVPVENLSRIITDSKYLHKGNAFIVTEKNHYIGCGGFYDLLRYITDLKIQNALYANPLSGLPGNVPIQKKMQSWLEKRIEFAMLYFDLDHFKAYNDYYSFEQGDGIIKAISALLQRHAKTDANNFLGHIGGDDFILLSADLLNCKQTAQNILDEFEQLIRSFYKIEDIEQGGILGVDREGKQKLFSIMSMSIGIVQVRPGIIEHQQQLSSIATRAKKKAKKKPGNSYCTINLGELSPRAIASHGNSYIFKKNNKDSKTA